ncbi:MAG: hypothetical protein RhofKO_03000 [Rhodothermales bacterium]
MRPLLRSEEMLLLAVWKLQPNAYGVPIRQYLSEVTGRDWPIASVYVPLDRLVDYGLIRPTDGAPTGKRGGRRRRLFSLTPKGQDALAELNRIHAALWEGFPKLGLQNG